MAYVERGVVKSKRSIWRLRTITDFFWAIVNFIGVFFSTMFSMEKTDAYRKGSGSSKKWDGGPGGPGSGPYGGGPRGPPRGLDNVRGIDHSEFILLLYLFLYINVFVYQPFVEHNFDILNFQVPCPPVAPAVAKVSRYL
ncbi:hypothetical protein SADUNF_Sadunf02G0072700 [Salix dunnii]|uniref:Glycine-rich protein n=1 Tax=Salix dunnii TaxID=1413687 RepID=A0A835N6K8_9ROSI|nr:hypothetical protein SADUNF_Sadunf02G0072700 [Salix dunnii]